MKRRYHFFSAAIMVLCGLCILLPLLVLGLWSVAANWPWPELFPQRFSLRAIGELFGGYSGAMEAGIGCRTDRYRRRRHGSTGGRLL